MSEKDLCNTIVEYLNYNQCFVWRQNAGMLPIEEGGKRRMVKVGRKGISDIIGIHRKTGRFIAIEVKMPKRKRYVTQAQQAFMLDISMAGGIAGVATSPDEALKIVGEELKRLKN